jgi:hypothetical protein
MSPTDPHGLPATGATTEALPIYGRALHAVLSWRGGAEPLLEQALDEAPGFVMAHLLRAWMLATSRDPRRVRAARPLLAVAQRLPATPQERLHMAAMSNVLADDYDGAADVIGAALQAEPRDALALSIACGLDYLGGDAERMRVRVERVLPAWQPDLPAYASVQAMHAFALAECGEAERAEQRARVALAHDPGDARAHHAMAHAFEMADRPELGARWLNEHLQTWSGQTALATHGAWHLALFELALGRDAAALGLYDHRVRAGRSVALADLIDATALLWRLRLRGTDGGARWAELAGAWAPFIDDGFCTFSDIHAMLAFVGAGDWPRAQRLDQALQRSRRRPTRHGRSTQLLGLAACRALMAFGRADLARTVDGLASLPAQAHRLGGSHAQRDVLHLTLVAALEGLRRPRRGIGALHRAAAVPATHETRQPAPRHAAAMPAA